jgi:hypothetical protein
LAHALLGIHHRDVGGNIGQRVGIEGRLDAGDQLTGGTLAADWDFRAHVEPPLDAVRQSMSVPPLDPADAADGRYPDWYVPTA